MNAQRLHVVVVGGGVAGLGVAMDAAKAGFRVTLIEAAHVGFEATSHNQGWLHSGGVFALDQPELAGLCRDSLARILAFCPECVEPDAGEALYLFAKAETEVSSWSAAWNRLGISAREISKDQARSRMPVLAVSPFEAAYVLPDRSCRTHVLLEKMQKTAEANGATLRIGVRVEELRLDEAGEVASVRLSTEEALPADFVVLASGAGDTIAGTESFQEVGEQREVEVVRLKNHLVAMKPQLGPSVLCVPDEHRLNHMPHAPWSVVGIESWKPAASAHADEVVDANLEPLWSAFRRFFPKVDLDQFERRAWAGVTAQAMLPEQVVPGAEPLPVVLDHSQMPKGRANLISVYPGRMSLWPVIADRTVALLREKAEG